VTDEHLPPMGLGALLRQPHKQEAPEKKRVLRGSKHKEAHRVKTQNFFSPCARGIEDPTKRILAVLEHEGVTFVNHLCARAGVNKDQVVAARAEGVIVRTWKKYATGSGALAYCLPCQTTEQQREMFTC
jgi:hypothetical protein